MNMNEWQKEDLKYIWHPCSQMKDYEELPPIVIERGEGINLYDIDGKIYFGEYTFYHMSGFQPFKPEEWDYTFGSWIDLNKIKVFRRR